MYIIVIMLPLCMVEAVCYQNVNLRQMNIVKCEIVSRLKSVFKGINLISPFWP